MLTSASNLRKLTFTTICLCWLLCGNGPNVAQAQTRIYATDGCTSSLLVIDAATNSVFATIPVGDFPTSVAVTPDGTRVYVAAGNSDHVVVIDTATNTVVTTIPLQTNPDGLAISPDGALVYVGTGFTNAIAIISTATNTVVGNIPVGFITSKVAITPDGKRLYATNHFGNTVAAIDIATETVIATITIGMFPQLIAASPDGARVYVTTLPGTLFVIDTATNTVIDSVFINGALGLALTTDGTRAYTTAFDTIPVIDTATNDIVDTIAVDGAPNVIAVTPDGTRAYAGVLKIVSRVEVKTTITGFDTASKLVIGEIPISCPLAIAIHDIPPRNKNACRDGAFQNFGALGFRNQGQCIKYVNEHAR